MEKSYKLSNKTVVNPEEQMSQFLGKWSLLRKDNFDEFLKASGINYILRKAANALVPTEIIEETDEKHIWHFRTETILKSAATHFGLLKEFTETTIDGRKMKTTFSIEILNDEEDGTVFYALVQRQVDTSGRNIEIIRFIRDEILHVILKVGDTVATAQFQPLK